MKSDPAKPWIVRNNSSRNCDEEPVLLVDVYEVCEWTPERDGNGTSTEVHLVMNTAKTPLFVRSVLRLKSRRAIDEMIAILQYHRDGVWPGDA